MADFRIVKGNGPDGALRTMTLTASGAIEEGDLVTITAGVAVKVATGGAAVAGIALEAVANGASGLFGKLDSGTVIEGTDISATDIVVGDLVGIDVTSTVQTFDATESNKTFRCTKVVTAGSVVQCQVLDSVIG